MANNLYWISFPIIFQSDQLISIDDSKLPIKGFYYKGDVLPFFVIGDFTHPIIRYRYHLFQSNIKIVHLEDDLLIQIIHDHFEYLTLKYE